MRVSTPTAAPAPTRTVVDARTVPVTITTLPPSVRPAPSCDVVPLIEAPLALPADGRAAPVRRATGPRARRRWLAAAVTGVALAAVAAAGVLVGASGFGLSVLTTIGRLAVGIGALAGLVRLASGATGGVHCPGCRGWWR